MSDKINDFGKFKHGQEGTHYACQEVLLDDTMRTCCGCTGHKCNPNPTEKRECVIQKKKIMLHKTKEYATDVIPNPTVESWEKELEQILIEWEGKDNAILGAVRVLSRTKRLEQFISSQIQQAEERLVERIIKELITIRDTEMEGRKDLMKTRAGYNVNLLIEYLATLKEEKDL